MKKAIAALLVGIAFSMGTTVAMADNGSSKSEKMFKMVDASGDGMVSREEFLAAMGKMYDEKMEKFKKMGKDGASMMKDKDMTHGGFMAFYKDLYSGS